MSPHDYEPGQPIPGTQYRYVSTIGAGGHGVVCAVEHTFLEAPAVMKLLHPELVNDGDLAHRMTREARTLAKLRHPNIVEVRDGGITGEDPPRPYFVMESLTGMSLRALLEQMEGRGIGVLPAIRIMSGVIDGLHHAHMAGVIHRDVKPDNIFLHRTTTDLTVPKVLDFGIAHLSAGKRLTGRHFLGTPRYSSPEQLRGEPVTHTADLYSAGLVFWELVTGREPYGDKREIGPLLMAHLNEQLAATSLFARDGSPDVDFLIAYMTEKDPARRPPTGVAAAIAFRELQGLVDRKLRTAGDLESDDFKTQPTPMDNALLEASPGSVSLVREFPREHALPLAPGGTVPMGDRPALEPESPRVDRAARTRASTPAPLVQRPSGDTESLPPDGIARVSVTPLSAPAASERSPASDAHAVSSRRRAPESSAREWLARRPMFVFFGALAIIAVVGVPSAVLITKRMIGPVGSAPVALSAAVLEVAPTTTASSAGTESPAATPSVVPVAPPATFAAASAGDDAPRVRAPLPRPRPPAPASPRAQPSASVTPKNDHVWDTIDRVPTPTPGGSPVPARGKPDAGARSKGDEKPDGPRHPPELAPFQ